MSADQLNTAISWPWENFCSGIRTSMATTPTALRGPQDRSANTLLPAPDHPEQRDLGRNGTYLVLRQLQQDVQGFWQFLDRQAMADPTERKGWPKPWSVGLMEGEPLVPSTDRPIAESDQRPMIVS